jgi:hypothetical protein
VQFTAWTGEWVAARMGERPEMSDLEQPDNAGESHMQLRAGRDAEDIDGLNRGDAYGR